MSNPKHKNVDQNNADPVIRQYEGEYGQQEGAFPEDTLAFVSKTDPEPPDATLYGGDVDVAQHQTDGGEETVGGSSPTPDQDVVQELGNAVGITYEDNEPLRFGEKLTDRDSQRWELNPASSEDYQERLRDLAGKGRSTTAEGQPDERPTKRSTRARKVGKSAPGSGRRSAPHTRKAPKKRR